MMKLIRSLLTVVSLSMTKGPGPFTGAASSCQEPERDKDDTVWQKILQEAKAVVANSGAPSVPENVADKADALHRWRSRATTYAVVQWDLCSKRDPAALAIEFGIGYASGIFVKKTVKGLLYGAMLVAVLCPPAGAVGWSASSQHQREAMLKAWVKVRDFVESHVSLSFFSGTGYLPGLAIGLVK